MTTQLNCSEAEWSTRTELASLYRLAHHYGWTDIVSTHISARLADDPDHYLLNSHDLMFDEITASGLTKMNFDGAPHSHNADRVINLAGHIIHSGILNGRPDVNFVIHSHTRAGIAVSAMPDGLLPLSQHAGFVIGTLSSHPFLDSTASKNESDIMIRDLGDNFTMLLENHGLLVVGRTPAEAFTYHYFLEMACKIQVDILSCTDKPIEITSDAMEALHDWGSPTNGVKGEVSWPALMRLLDRTQPDYKD